MGNTEQNTVRRLADYERLSCIFWLILGIVQIFLVWTALAGIWNIIAAISRWKLPDRIRQRDPAIPALYEKINGLVIIGVVNLLLGALLGLVFVAFDFYVRDMVLTNAHLFNEEQLETSDVAEDIPQTSSKGFSNVVDQQLRSLAKLKDEGVITEDDFDRKKSELLGL